MIELTKLNPAQVAAGVDLKTFVDWGDFTPVTMEGATFLRKADVGALGTVQTFGLTSEQGEAAMFALLDNASGFVAGFTVEEDPDLGDLKILDGRLIELDETSELFQGLISNLYSGPLEHHDGPVVNIGGEQVRFSASPKIVEHISMKMIAPITVGEAVGLVSIERAKGPPARRLATA